MSRHATLTGRRHNPTTGSWVDSSDLELGQTRDSCETPQFPQINSLVTEILRRDAASRQREFQRRLSLYQ